MLELRPVEYLTIAKWLCEFQKKSKCFELPPETAHCIGVYNMDVLIGYFIVQAYENQEIEINQGYLLPAYRHKEWPSKCMKLLEQVCKEKGFQKVLLGTHNRFKAYLRFAKSLGYKPIHLVFEKTLQEI